MVYNFECCYDVYMVGWNFDDDFYDEGGFSECDFLSVDELVVELECYLVM